MLAAKLHGKTAIVVKDAPGFAVNRFFVPFLNEAARMLEEGMADIGDATPEEWVDRMLTRWDSDPITPEVVKTSAGQWLRLVDRRARDGDMVCLALNITEQMRIWAALEERNEVCTKLRIPYS